MIGRCPYICGNKSLSGYCRTSYCINLAFKDKTEVMELKYRPGHPKNVSYTDRTEMRSQDGGRGMTEEHAISILRNTAWLGSDEQTSLVEQAIKTLEPKTGKWIKNGNKCVCPFCGTGFTTASEEVRAAHKYGYYCGAKMEVDDDGEAGGD